MNISELRQLSETELNSRIGALREEMYNVRFQKATRQSATIRPVAGLKREIAQVYTVLREHELGIRPLSAASAEATGE